MKKFFYKILFILIFILCILSTNNSFAVCNVNVNYEYSSNNISYLKKCFGVAIDYLKKNNISKDYFFIFNQAANDNLIIKDFTIDNGTGSSDGNFFYIGFSNDPSIMTINNYCFNYGDLIAFCFACGDTNFGGNNAPAKSPYIFDRTNCNFDNLKIYFTNYKKDGICDKYDPYDFVNNYNITYQYNITLSTAEKTTGPVIAYSNYFNTEDFNINKCYISTNGYNWEELKNVGTHTENGITQCRYFYYILKNGNYYFKFLNTETQKTYFLSMTITNILSDSSNSGYNSSGIPQPFVTYERVGDYFILKTQSFNENDILKYKCLYTNSLSFTEDYSSWEMMGLGSLQNTQLNQTEYFFSLRVPKDSEDCTYFFVFYDSEKNEYGYFSSLECKFDKMNEYSDEVAGVVTTKKNKFNELLDFFRERFGFLTYPFEFISDLLNRILNIEYKEPIINIPEISIPGTDIKIFNGMEYNFNSILENEAISNIYNIYLIAVDFIIIVGVLILAKNTLMEVLGNG